MVRYVNMIFVDTLKRTPPRDESGGRWRWNNYCHLFAESLDELHKFAAEKCGLKRDYFQDLPGFPHYDLTATKRRLAVRAGAVEICPRDMVERADAIYGAPDSWLKRAGEKTKSMQNPTDGNPQMITSRDLIFRTDCGGAVIERRTVERVAGIIFTEPTNQIEPPTHEV